MRATPQQQGKLLELQKLEIDILRTNNQVKKHPLREKIVDLDGHADNVRRFIVGLKVDMQSVERDIERLEQEIQKVVNRGEVQQGRLDQGIVPMRDMSAVEHEIVRIHQRKDELEGELLEKMEQFETQEKALTDAQSQAQKLVEKKTVSLQELNEVLAEPEAKLAKLGEEQKVLRDSLPDDVIAEYDRLKGRQGLPVAFELRGGNLVNSFISLSAGELGQATKAHEDELWISSETGFLIVRP